MYESCLISLVKKQVKHIFGKKSPLLLNIVSIVGDTLGPASFQFFNIARKVGCLKACKILIDSDDNFLIRREFLPTESDFEIWE